MSNETPRFLLPIDCQLMAFNPPGYFSRIAERTQAEQVRPQVRVLAAYLRLLQVQEVCEDKAA